MKLTRRTFFKLGGAAALVTAAPLFIPAQNLDFGVPKPRVIVPTTDDIITVREGKPFALLDPIRNIPMLLLHDNYIPQHGGRLKAGSVVFEDAATAERWAQRGVAIRASKSLTEPDLIPGRDFNVRHPAIGKGGPYSNPDGFDPNHVHLIANGMMQPASRRVRDFGIQGG